MRDDKRANGIIAGALRVPDDVGVPFYETRKLSGIEPCIHAGQYRKAACGRQCETALAPNPATYKSFAAKTSSRTLVMGMRFLVDFPLVLTPVLELLAARKSIPTIRRRLMH